MIFVFWMLSFKPAFSLFSFTFIKRLFSSCLLSAIRVVSSAYLRLLIFLLTILIPACASSSPAFHVMYSAYMLNKQGDYIQSWRTPFQIWKQSVVPCAVVTCFLTCLLRNLYAQQETTVRTGYGTTDWFEIGKGVRQGCILSPCLFNFYAEYIMWNARLDEAQARIKTSGRNINNLRNAYDTTFMAESGEELKSLLMKVKEESWKSWLKTQHSEN